MQKSVAIKCRTRIAEQRNRALFQTRLRKPQVLGRGGNTGTPCIFLRQAADLRNLRRLVGALTPTQVKMLAPLASDSPQRARQEPDEGDNLSEQVYRW